MKLCGNVRFPWFSSFGKAASLAFPLIVFSGYLSPSYSLTNFPTKHVQPVERYGAGGIFGSLEIGTNLGAGKFAWREVLKRLDTEAPAYRACDQDASSCDPRVRIWRKEIQKAKSFSSIWKKLDHINRLANRLIRYRDDIDQFQKTDYWATPMQSISGRGDCEDYAIAKFAALSELGFAPENLKLVVVQDRKRRLAHAVLAFKYKNLTIILDNLSNNLKSHTEIKNYRPIYSINRTGYWMNVAVKIRDTRIAETQAKEVSKHVAEIKNRNGTASQNGFRGSLTANDQIVLSTIFSSI